MTHTEFGQRILTRIREQLEDVGQPEPGVRMEGRHMSMIINPKKGVVKPKSEDSKGKSGPKPKKEDAANPKDVAPAPPLEPVSQVAEKEDVTVGSVADQTSGGPSTGE
jgi:hypothetical protein